MILQKKLSAIFSILLLSTYLTGCVRAILPTSETELTTNARVVSTEVELDIVSSYANLKKYMSKCFEYRNQNGYQVIDANLDREQNKAYFIGKSNFDTYTFKVLLESVGNEQTKITYFSPKKKIGFSESNPQKTLDKLTAFSLYDGKAVCKL
ncbi:hypothetical protein [Psychrobacter sp. Ps2]|uniref:hypothetical protein n=1 Tax=Psychrobacter sp. Ps2 TaxID=2790956 RepID=UPI001EDD3207|nr:hypothetical protein [Psychrobacter sp. Ps2]MCG3857999.1 hypothetical protein [Psychrobacter sp. Ps2]